MKHINSYTALLLCLLLVGNVSALVVGDIDGKGIAEQAKSIGIDSSKTARASGEGISGVFTPSKASAAQTSDKQNGYFFGFLELQVNADYGLLKSGKYNLFLKEDGGLKMFFESGGQIRARLEVLETTPEGYTDKAGSGDLAFPLPADLDRNSSGDEEGTHLFAHANPRFKRCKIYIKVGKKWVWSGVTKKCGSSSSE
jgi:hypothetical protein